MFCQVETVQWRDQERRWKGQNGEGLEEKHREDKKGKELVSELQKPKAKADLMAPSDTTGP